jgi:hypothetical protein
MTIQHHIIINAPREAVFAVYQRTEGWPLWDDEVRAVDLPAGLVAGASGSLTPRKGPQARVKVTSVVKNGSFVVEAALPFCVMSFGHDLTDEGTSTRAVHSVSFTGPLAFIFRRLIGRDIARTLPGTLFGLKQFCEAE